MAVEVFSGTEAIGATEHSFTTDTTGPDTDTTAGDYLLVLDLSDMVTGDDFRIRIYEKVRAGDTQRVLHEWFVNGAQSTLWSMHNPVPLLHGWDMTGYAVAGTITVLWSIRAMGGDTSAFASDVAAIKAKTDNLPSDPADASVVAGLIAAVETKVDDLPTNAELATALGTADDAVLTQVALVKAVTDKLDDTLEDDGGTFRFTENALEEGPAGGGGGDATEAKQDIIIAAVADLPTNAELATALGTADDAVLAQVALVKAKTDGLPSDPADASVVAGLIAAVETKVDTIDDLLDTEVGAIKTVVDAVKAKTDSLTFTVAGKADANITHVNETEVTGNGETGTEWGPA